MFVLHPSKWLFFLMTTMGTLVCISANSWPATWMGLEINLLGFIPLILTKKNILSSEASMKYFLIQALASSLFLIFIVFSFLLANILTIYYDILNQLLVSSTLMIKMGAAPFHFWFPPVMEGLSWNNCYILMTWQKIAPMILLSYLNLSFVFLVIIALFSVTVGSLGGLNQTSIRKIMTYSSINHIGWMIMALIHSQILWLIYFLIYSVISLNVIFFFKNASIHHFTQLPLKMNQSPITKMLIVINLLSLGGLPPFLGFLPKWFILQALTSYDLLISLPLVVMTLITLYFYVRLIISTFLINQTNIKWNHTSTFLNYSLIVTSLTISMTGLILMPISFLI
uniref:NADH dehydrogenase subunit 2 n=1 Tax=Vescelia pieli TaxID=2526987 RepID=UPI0030E18151